MIPDGRLNRTFYGGKSNPDDNDSSGVIAYVRIEYAGIPQLNPGDELNTLTMGGVGRKTEIHHVMSTDAGDDAFEWFGGTVNGRYLIARRTQDDDFDSDFGWSGNVQFGLSLRDNNIYDTDASNGFESDNNNFSASLFAGVPQTKANFANITCIGFNYPTLSALTTADAGNKHEYALRIRRNTRIGVFNSIFAGYQTGLSLENDSTVIAVKTLGNAGFQFSNNVLAQMVRRNFRTSGLGAGVTFNATDSTNFFNNNSIQTAALLSELNFSNPFDQNGPTFNVTGSPTIDVRSGAAWTNARLAGNSYFEQVSYRGAVDPNSSRPWHLAPWTNWDPQNAAYDTTLRAGAMLQSLALRLDVGGTTVNTTVSVSGTAIAITAPFATNVNDIGTVFNASPGSYISVAGGAFQGRAPLNVASWAYSGPVTVTVTSENGTVTNTYTITITIGDQPRITAYSFQPQAGFTSAVVGSITNPLTPGARGEITLTVPAGTSITSLVATFSLSSTATNPLVGATAQVSGTTANNFTNPVIYTITDALSGLTYEYEVEVSVGQSSSKNITAYSFQPQTGLATAVIGTINQTARTIALTVPQGTNRSALVATFTLSPLASATVGSIAQVSGTTPNNFTNPVTYTVTAEDGTTQNYTVTVSIATAIDPSLNVLQANIYPNPAATNVNIDLFAPVTGVAQVELIDLNGKVVAATTHTVVNGLNSVEFNLNNVSNGVYTVRTTLEGNMLQQRLVVTR